MKVRTIVLQENTVIIDVFCSTVKNFEGVVDIFKQRYSQFLNPNETIVTNELKFDDLPVQHFQLKSYSEHLYGIAPYDVFEIFCGDYRAISTIID